MAEAAATIQDPPQSSPEAPPAPRRPVPYGLTPFTSQTASEAARRKHQLEREAKAALLAPPPAPPTQDHVATAVCAQLALVAEQIQQTRTVLNRAATHHCKACGKPSGAFLDMEPHHRAALLRALDQLLDRQRVLLAIPLPGSLKPSGKPARPPRAGLGDARAESEPGQAAGAALG